MYILGKCNQKKKTSNESNKKAVIVLVHVVSFSFA